MRCLFGTANLGIRCKEKSCMQGPIVTEVRGNQRTIDATVQEREERIFILANVNVRSTLHREIMLNVGRGSRIGFQAMDSRFAARVTYSLRASHRL